MSHRETSKQEGEQDNSLLVWETRGAREEKVEKEEEERPQTEAHQVEDEMKIPGDEPNRMDSSITRTTRPHHEEENDNNPESTQRRTTWRQSLFRRAVSVEKLSDEIQSQLQVASEALLNLLFEHLSRGMKGSSAYSPEAPVNGLSLPVTAVGWLSQQLFLQHSDDGNNRLRERISLLRFLLPRATHVRLTSEEWPPPLKSRRLRRKRRRNLGRLRSEQQSSGNSPPAVGKQDDGNTQPFPHLTPFLQFYDALVHRPVVDMRVFPQCQVLLLDQVPVEWITNLPAISSTLRVLRVERSCIYNLRQFLAPAEMERSESLAPSESAIESGAQQDPIAPPATQIADGGITLSGSANDWDAQQDPLAPLATQITDGGDYTQLTHVKLSYCGITDLSDLKRPRRSRQLAPPLARLVNMQSICMSHNQLSSESAALAGLSDMPHLTKVDLSFNALVSLRKIHYRLGNIQTLLLSHNRLESVAGIDRLYALEILWLDHNRLEEMAQVSGLARLPELKSLRLKGNPLINNGGGPIRFRVDLLDLFREQRGPLPRNATYGDLQRLLPVLDQRKASIPEMLALKQRIYLPAAQRTEAPRSDEMVMPAIDVSMESGISERRVPGSAITPSRPPGRRSKRGVAWVDRPPTRLVKLAPLALPTNKQEQSVTGERVPNVDFSVQDVIESLCEAEHVEEDESGDEGGASSEYLGATALKGLLGEEEVEPGRHAGTSLTPEAQHSGHGMLGNGDASVKEANGTILNLDGQLERDEAHNTQKGEAVASENDTVPLPQPPNDKKLPERELSELTHSSATDPEDLALSPVKRVNDTNESKKSTETTVNSIDTSAGANFEETVLPSPKAAAAAAFPSDADFVTPAKPRRNISETFSEQTPSSASPVHLPLSFPDIVPSGDHSSVYSSVGSPRREGTISSRIKYQQAEENSSYDGPAAYKNVKILEDLELYFRLFVFPVSQIEVDAVSRSTTTDETEEEEWRHVLNRYPRIQLWPVDIRARESFNNNVTDPPPESFRRLWREKVVACGKSALRRLTPNRAARYGFHGELLWSDSSASHLKPETVAECRQVVMCCSNTSLYFILDYDKVTAKAKEHNRKFPLPIPTEARFKDAVWPHALARHPLSTLRVITIGFKFQRLTLRFGKSATTTSPDDFTYILLTSSKVQTISLLKEFQDIANEAKVSTADTFAVTDDALLIQNDDRHVLDALGVAVAPDVVGLTLHYQVLQQQWRRGERGSVRRVVVVTDTKIFLLDEDYVGDGSESYEAGTRQLGETVYRLVDSAALEQIARVQAADADPNSITIVINPQTSFKRAHNWRLKCRDRHGAERLVEDVRRAMMPVTPRR